MLTNLIRNTLYSPFLYSIYIKKSVKKLLTKVAHIFEKSYNYLQNFFKTNYNKTNRLLWNSICYGFNMIQKLYNSSLSNIILQNINLNTGGIIKRYRCKEKGRTALIEKKNSKCNFLYKIFKNFVF